MSTAWSTYTPQQKDDVMSFAENYMGFLSQGKTERLCVKQAIELAKGFGYKNMNEIIYSNGTLKPQDKVYFNIFDKALVLVQIGNAPIEQGLNILAAHIDAPRLDLKPSPVYQEGDLAYFDTHYYGGIKKYQWLALPLALYGTIYLTDGTHIDVAIGDHEQDPVFCISDLLPHLAKDQMAKKAGEIITAENMNLLVGSIPLEGDQKDAVKANILQLLKNNYGIDEEDFVSAELEIVPAGKSRTLGLDESMILAYGQDDRSCAYTSLVAQLECGEIERTALTALVDKEEIGSYSATGSQSNFIENAVREVLHAQGIDSETIVMRALANSTALSNDVSVAHDPNFAEVSSANGNQAVLGNGLVVAKYTGRGGKSGCNDANPEFIAYIRKIFKEAGVVWQTGELGKPDQGGGGTISWMLSRYSMQCVDTGVALMSMHAPFEISSKADVFEAKKAYSAFLKNVPSFK
jgi:aspartyl aminopeptidase